jgi:sec-independent protein translocase protein TatC
MAEPLNEELPRMSLLEHLEELRSRILRSLIAIAVAFFACWAVAERLFAFLARPIYDYLPEGTRLAFLGVTDPFILYVKVAALAAIFFASPIVLYQVYSFVAPGLYRREKRYALPFVLSGSLFFLAGGLFAYYVAFPFAVEFLLAMGEDFDAVITIERYFGFLMTVILGLGLMFEMPILILLLAKMGVVTPRFLIRNFRWAVLIIFVIAAIITPTPDVVNLCIFAVPTIGLYLLGVAAAWVVTRSD